MTGNYGEGLTKILAFGVWVDLNSYSDALAFFLWSLKGTATNEVFTGFADHWRGSASNGSQIMASGSNWRVNGDGFNDFDGCAIYALLAAVRPVPGHVD